VYRYDGDTTGIGLGVSKQVTDNHGGIIYASLKPDVEATFTILILWQESNENKS